MLDSLILMRIFDQILKPLAAYKVIVDAGETRINYPLVEIESEYNLNCCFSRIRDQT